MFVSFLTPSIFEGVHARHLLVLYKQLAAFGRDQIAFIGEPDYFRAPADLEAEGRPEWTPSWRETYEYDPPANLDDVFFETIPEDLFARRLARAGSSWRLYHQLMSRRLPELEMAVDAALDRLQARTQAPIEAIIGFANVPSLVRVARRRGIKYIQCEYGPLRKPLYPMTGYWNVCTASARADARRRLRAFTTEVARTRTPLLEREEIHSLLWRGPALAVSDPSTAPFRAGLALQGDDNTYAQGVGPLDLHSLARRRYGRDEILIRHHSAALTHCSEQLGVIDRSSSATEFILQCETIVTANSGTALEALLLGRECLVAGDSAFGVPGSASLVALNFLALAYIVPLDLMFDPEYTRWRLTGPPEIDILKRHLHWYRQNQAEAPAVVAQAAEPEPVPAPAVIAPPRRGSVLVVFPFCLDHVGHGNIQRLLAIARYLAANGYDVDLVYHGNAHIDQVREQYNGFHRVFRVDGSRRSSEDDTLTQRVRAFYGGRDLPVPHMRPSGPMASLIRVLVETTPYRAVVSTYAFTAPLFHRLANRILTICDVQDILHEHSSECEKATGRASSFCLPKETEEFLWRQWDVLVAITPEDQARIARDARSHQQLLSARHAMASIAESPAAGHDDIALYAASDNGSNVHSVTWLLERVWPRVRAMRPNARLRIAGLICRALPESAKGIPGVELLGFRPNIADDITACGVVVAPYLYGSGLKIKVVEAACTGKAVVTTTGGAYGSGLEHGRSIEVHDDPDAFASALAALLGDRSRRAQFANAALTQARALFTPDACYAPIVGVIERFADALPTGPSEGVTQPAINRIQTIVDEIAPERVILWGNGAHTRNLVAALRPTTVDVSLIADGRATTEGLSPEGIAVVPSKQLSLDADDLVILSSETYEHEMWRDLKAFRSAGGAVLGLQDASRLSRGLAERLSAPALMACLEVPPQSARVLSAYLENLNDVRH